MHVTLLVVSLRFVQVYFLRCISLAPCQRVGPWLSFLAASQSSRRRGRVQKARRLRCPASGHLGTSTPLDTALLAFALTAYSDLDDLAAPAHRRVARRAASRSRELGRIRKRTVSSLLSAPPASRCASQNFPTGRDRRKVVVGYSSMGRDAAGRHECKDEMRPHPFT